MRCGWCLGSVDFKNRMLEKLDGRLGEHHSGELRRERAEAKVERSVAEELCRLSREESELVPRCKHDADRLAIAVRSRRETTLPIKVIAQRMHPGTWRSGNAHLPQAMMSNA